jgi:hypothetical protein
MKVTNERLNPLETNRPHGPKISSEHLRSVVQQNRDEGLYSPFVFAVWNFFALVAIVLICFRPKKPNLVRPCRTWGYPWARSSFGCRDGFDGQTCGWSVRPVPRWGLE